jgi:hypothetical protein
MTRLGLSPAAAGLLRAIIRRGRCERDRILLTEALSTEWQSLTFVGERHRLQVRIAGTDAGEIADRIANGLAEAEFAIPGQIVADVGCDGEREIGEDGSISLLIEALTVED